MIVLDEQLMGRGIETAIAAWYPGTVQFIHLLRQGTVVKDDAVPKLLESQNSPTFVTINIADFWHKVAITKRFCVICVDLPDPRAREIPDLLKTFLRHPMFNTKAKRSGKVIRLSDRSASYYSLYDPLVRPLPHI